MRATFLTDSLPFSTKQMKGTIFYLIIRDRFIILICQRL